MQTQSLCLASGLPLNVIQRRLAGLPVQSQSLPADTFVKTSAGSQGIDPTELDTSVRPQDNFDEFAVGGYLKTHDIPSDKPAWGVLQQMAETNQDTLHTILDKLPAGAPGSNDQKLHDFYQSGMDQAAIEKAGLTPLNGEFARLDAVQTPQDLQDEFAHLQTAGLAGPFGFGSTQDAKNPTQVIGEAGQGGLGMPNRDYYLNADKASVRTAYLAHVEKMLTLAGDDPAKAKQEAQTIMGIETRLAQASSSPTDLRDPSKTYHIMDRKALADMTPNFDWNGFFGQVGRPDIQSINVPTPGFFKAFDGMLKDTSVSDWKTYLRWQMLNQTAAYLPKRFDDENFAFKGTVLTGVTEPAPRWQRVVRSTDGVLGDALGQKFVAEKFPPEAKAQAKQMIENILDAARAKIKTGWMSDPTKKAAIDKVDHLQIKVGYPDHWQDYSKLDVKPDSYTGNMLRSWQFGSSLDLAKIGQPVDRTEWGMTPATVNAYYNAQQNEIVFPAGILQPPLFDPKADAASNYGAIGSVIGHELTHGFDDEGSQYDSTGQLRNWWTPADKATYDKKADGVAQQFSKFIFDGQSENGKLVEGEAIADLGGLELAWSAYQTAEAQNPSKIKDSFTPDQRFWVSHAMCWATNMRPQYAHLILSTDPHPLDQFRVIGPAQDMDEFYQAFNVQPGDGMYLAPDQRNHLWNS
ncbi:MAG TPA: M13 family metallopeptidase [Candidatus Xenobia bacterium]